MPAMVLTTATGGVTQAVPSDFSWILRMVSLPVSATYNTVPVRAPGAAALASTARPWGLWNKAAALPATGAPLLSTVVSVLPGAVPGVPTPARVRLHQVPFCRVI